MTERFVATADILQQDPEAMWPVTRQIVEGGQLRQASEVFRSIYDLAALRVEVHRVFKELRCTAHPHRGQALYRCGIGGRSVWTQQ